LENLGQPSELTYLIEIPSIQTKVWVDFFGNLQQMQLRKTRPKLIKSRMLNTAVWIWLSFHYSEQFAVWRVAYIGHQEFKQLAPMDGNGKSGDPKMKILNIACLIGLATATLSLTPAYSANMASNSKYCMSNGYDPICMSPKMLKMRMAMMSMTKAKAMSGRTKYCRNATYADPICKKQMMNSTLGY
jgi:hypothetical protein